MKERDYNGIIKEIDSKKFYPVYFLCGEEPYFIDKIAARIEQGVLEESEKGFNQTVVYGKDTDPDNIINMARRYPMMSDYQVIIIREAQHLKKIENLMQYFREPVKSTILAICYKHKRVDKRTKFYKEIKNNAVFYESRRLYSNKIPKWIGDQAKHHNLQINENGIMLLAEYLGDDLHKIENALEKLAVRKEGSDDKNVSLGDIEENIGISRDFNVFELQKALGQKDRKKLAMIVDYMQANPNQNPFPKIIGTLFNYFSKVIILQYSKEDKNTIAQRINVPEYFLKEYQQAASNYKGRLQKIIGLLHEYDLRSKGINDAGTEPGELLREMVSRILTI